MRTTIETYSNTTVSTLTQARNKDDSDNLSSNVCCVKQSNEQECHKRRVSPTRQPLPLEMFKSQPMLKTKNIDLQQQGLDSALMGAERALTSELFTTESFKNDFRQLATGNGSLRAMATALQGLMQFGSGEVKALASELLNKEIQLVQFSQFGTYSGVASLLIEEASIEMLDEIVAQLNDIYDVVSKNILGNQV